jgi:ATP-dependent exoDNAse (exonuclease V) beta subunit
MTIHQAKGLEFDIVIIPKAAAQTRSSDRDLIIWTEVKDEHGEPGLQLAALPQRAGSDPAYDFVCQENNQKESHELKRLFYVACTRARNELYLLGNVKSKRGGTECSKASSSSFLGLIWDTVQALFASELRRKVAVQAPKFANATKAPATTWLRRLPAGWRAPAFESSVRWTAPMRTAIASEHEIPYVWVSDTGRHVGSVVHELLKRVGREGLSRWNTERITALGPLITSELKRLGVASAAQAVASSTVIRALRTTLESKRGQWILQSWRDAQSEWPVAGSVADQLISGTIDRMFQDEEGRLWIVDFKTSEHEGGRAEQFLDKEQQRYRIQLESYGTLMSRLTKAPIWLGLYFPLLDGWREWQLKTEAAVTAHYTEV